MKKIFQILNGFVEYFKGQWETVKGAVTDPWGHVKNNLKQYLEKPWALTGPGALYETVLKPMVLEAVGQWEALFEGDMSGLSYRAGEATAAGIELLVLSKLGEVVGKYLVKSDGSLRKVAGEGKTQAGAAAGGSEKIIDVNTVNYSQSSLDKAFSKHSRDFGVYPDGSNASKTLFQNDINKLIETGVQKAGTYRATAGTHVYNPATRQWAFFNADGYFNTAFKLSLDQYKYLIETGVVK